MGWFSSLFGSTGLSNYSTNMKNPLGDSRCRQLCAMYDNYGGYKIPARLLIGTPTGPGMELYEIFKASDGRHLFRGVIFAAEYRNDQLVTVPYVFEFFDVGDGGCPCLERKGELVHVDGDLYRTTDPLVSYVDGKKMNTICELNWNKNSNEFVYREVYTPAES